MKNNKPEVAPLAFIDYFQLKQVIKQQDTPEQLISPKVVIHDNDKLTYKEAYQLLAKMLEEVTSYTDAYGSVAMDTLGGLTQLLASKGLLTKAEVLELQNNIQKDWKD